MHTNIDTRRVEWSRLPDWKREAIAAARRQNKAQRRGARTAPVLTGGSPSAAGCFWRLA